MKDVDFQRHLELRYEACVSINDFVYFHCYLINVPERYNAKIPILGAIVFTINLMHRDGLYCCFKGHDGVHIIYANGGLTVGFLVNNLNEILPGIS